jgi:hypothetical protein
MQQKESNEDDERRAPPNWNCEHNGSYCTAAIGAGNSLELVRQIGLGEASDGQFGQSSIASTSTAETCAATDESMKYLTQNACNLGV